MFDMFGGAWNGEGESPSSRVSVMGKRGLSKRVLGSSPNTLRIRRFDFFTITSLAVRMCMIVSWASRADTVYIY